MPRTKSFVPEHQRPAPGEAPCTYCRLRRRSNGAATCALCAHKRRAARLRYRERVERRIGCAPCYWCKCRAPLADGGACGECQGKAADYQRRRRRDADDSDASDGSNPPSEEEREFPPWVYDAGWLREPTDESVKALWRAKWTAEVANRRRERRFRRQRERELRRGAEWSE